MSYKFLLSVISFLLFSQNIVFGQIEQPAFYQEPAAYEVYAALLDSIKEKQPTKNFVIRTETSGDRLSMCLKPEEESEKVLSPAIADYTEQNKKKLILQNEFKIETPYQLVTTETINSVLKINNDRWKSFYEKYPDSTGVIEFSAVGFNPEKTIAVVYQGNLCGDLCGFGTFHILQKKDGKWIPLEWKGNRCSWAS